jgi:hypothetical protein
MTNDIVDLVDREAGRSPAKVETSCQTSAAITSFRFGSRIVVGAHIAAAHQAVFIEFPMLVAVGAKPLPGCIAPFVFKAHRDAVVGEGPQFFHQAIIEFLGPLAAQEFLDGGATGENSARLRHSEFSEYASATRSGSREFQASSAALTLASAVSRVKGGLSTGAGFGVDIMAPSVECLIVAASGHAAIYRQQCARNPGGLFSG